MGLVKQSSLSVRLIRMGCKNRPFYQIGALPTRRRSNLLPDEVIGNVDPIPNQNNEIIASCDLKRLAYWTGKGVVFSKGIQNILGMAGWLPIPPAIYIKALENRENKRQKTDKSEEQTEESDEFVVDSLITKKRIV
ncbi:probable 28S ribosomal protein S16, mitochondrial [Oppia nitens]|uniref:probable 28S ribosomal protein S16, mitochondrial n=1 Tax=Oppia nitens TaxID=1686743 RepID=UPI0023DAD5E9|nr:probable 28S ribosomal protein S16, mitochondrial [Oppia nitens]